MTICNTLILRCILILSLSLWAISSTKAQLMDLKKLSMERIYYRLDKAAAEPTEVYRLYVDEFTNTWEEIAEVLAQCEHLQELTVAGEFFQVLPEEILRFKGQLQIITLKEKIFKCIHSQKRCSKTSKEPIILYVGLMSSHFDLIEF